MDTAATVPFQAGSPILVTGPTHCGKTFWVSKILKNHMFTEPVKSIMYCYGVYQKFYDEMKSDPGLENRISFHEGLPTKEDIDALNDGEFHVLVLDDLMEHIVKSADMQQLFTKYCHHLNITAIFISQNIFQSGPHARTISLNCHVIVVFANKRDESQIKTFARQLYPSKWRRFMAVYEKNMNYEYCYLVIDCTPSHPREMKVRSNIFPGELTHTYDI